MRMWAIVALPLIVCLSCSAFPVIPLLTTPDNPAYTLVVPEIISGAETRVLCALSDMRRYSGGETDGLLSALAAAAEAGVETKVLLEMDEDGPLGEQLAAFSWLKGSGVDDVSWDDPQVTLHAKLLVVDDAVVVGSTHWTKSALFYSVQTDLVVESAYLASIAAEFFHLLWEGNLGVEPILPQLPWPEGATLPLFDLPEAGLHAQVLPQLLDRATRTIDLLLYRFSYYPQYPVSPSNSLVEGILSALRRGVRVRILLEGGEDFPDLAEGNRLVASFLSLHGAEVRLDPPTLTTHAKCLIVDGRDVLVSSANWSYYSLAKNVEAGLALLDAPGLAAPLVSWFEMLWGKS